MLELRHVSKRYRGIPAVDDVSFSVGPGEVVGYLGPNGSGKSTTVKIITGMLEPSAGSVLSMASTSDEIWRASDVCLGTCRKKRTCICTCRAWNTCS